MSSKFRVALVAVTTALMSVAACATETPAIQPSPRWQPPSQQQAAPTGVDYADVVCGKARLALTAVRAEGTSQRVYRLVEDFLNAANQSGDPVLLYQAAQVGDAHRGSGPEFTLEPALANMVATCQQGGH